MWVFGSLNAPILPVYKAIELNICLVREPYVSNIDITLIHKLQHSVREIIACINCIHTHGSARLDLGKHVKVVAHDTVCGHSSESSTRCNTANGCPGCCRRTCCTASAFDSITALRGRPTFPIRSSLTFPVRSNFSNRAFTALSDGPLLT
ncbi:hypothetical protein AVEN_25376-1 [Araneus ventricosus]|uniref:Uncharacterized protein n=1 Tax=Araneus ventricosus TaxID=182803 RepID=A0A4Y2EF32_ARAVE|nr:hypothetical protein AVEN_25376-1 [Araneus ventricosus]